VPRAAVLANALAVALLVATATAFVVAEALKLEKSPLTGTRVDEVFSPVCNCATDRAGISFRVRSNEHVTVEVLGATGDVVRTLARSRPVRAGRTSFSWDGRDDAGRMAPDDTYRLRVELENLGRTFDLPNRIDLDTTAPEITIGRSGPWTISPDRDGRADRFTVRYHFSEPATAALYIDGTRRLLNRGIRLAHKFEWNGRSDGQTELGTHRLAIAARDVAGNVARQALPSKLRVRLVALKKHRFAARAGGRLRVPVDTDANRIEWRLGSRSGKSSAHPLVLRAPQRPGRYALVLRNGPQTARASVLVRRP
jgi:hypothetical protein